MVNKDSYWLSRIHLYSGFATFSSKRLKDEKGRASRDEFLLDILQAIFLENVSESTKVQMLILLQEQSWRFIRNLEQAEQVVGSLHGLLGSGLGKHGEFFISQVFITVTQVVLEHDMNDTSTEVFQKFLATLLDAVCKVNTANQALIRKTGADCLLEIERICPGTLAGHLSMLFGCCRQERTFAFQSYFILVAEILRHFLEAHSDDANASVTEKDVQLTVAYLLEEALQMSSCALSQFLMQVGSFADKVKISKVMYNSLIIHCSRTYDASLVHAAIHLQNKCANIPGQQLAPTYFRGKLCRMLAMPQLPTGLRLSAQRWLLSLNTNLMKLGFPQQESCMAILPFYFSSIFDGTDVLRGKYEAICTLLRYLQMKDSIVSSLIESLTPLMKPVEHGLAGKTAALLFRIIYILISKYAGNALSEKAFHLVYILNAKHPKFVTNTIDLLDALKESGNENSYFPLVKDLADYAINLTNKEIADNFTSHLMLFERATMEKDLLPLEILQRLSTFLRCRKFKSHETWEEGNQLLRVCRAILACHCAEQIICGTADLLWFVSRSFADDDIRDRAYFLYLTIGYVSPSKYKNMFFVSSDAGEGLDPKTIESIDDTTTITIKDAETLPESSSDALAIERSEVSPCFLGETFDAKWVPRGSDVLQDYNLLMLSSSFPKKLQIKYALRYANGSFDQHFPSEVFAVTLQLTPADHLGAIEDVSIPYICRKDTKDHQSAGQSFYFYLDPVFPLPGSIGVRCHAHAPIEHETDAGLLFGGFLAVFSTSDGGIRTVRLNSLKISLEDFFCPLPFPYKEDNAEEKRLFRLEVFNSLWERISASQRTRCKGENRGALSVNCIRKSKNHMACLIRRYLVNFVLDTTDDNTMVGIWLPPSYHILLKFQTFAEDCLVLMATDDWQLMEAAEEYMGHMAKDYVASELQH